MNIEIANRLQQMRKKNNLSQEELAAKIGVSRQAVSKWERAEASPDTDNLILLAKLYGISLDELVRTDNQPETESQGISLKKDDYGYTEEPVKEVIPENYTDEEIYPGRSAQDIETNNSIPQGSPFGADIDDEEKKDSDVKPEAEDFAKTLERAGRAIGDVINAAGKKVEEGLKKADEEKRKADADNFGDERRSGSNSGEWEEKFEQGMKKFEAKMEQFGESMNKMGEDIDRKVNAAFADKHEEDVHIHKKHKDKNEPATLLDKLFPVLITFLFLCSIPLNLAHPGWTLFLLIPLYYTTKEAVRKRNPMVFCYPVFCVWFYCTIGGFLDVFIPGLSDNWYGLMWLIFLTIPLFYTAYPAVKKRNPLIFCYPVLCVLVYLGVGIFLDMLWEFVGAWWLSIMWAPIFLSIPVYYIVLSHYRKKKNL